VTDISKLSDEEKRQLLTQLLAQKHGGAAYYPLSFTQERLWFLARTQPDVTIYNIARAFRVVGPFDVGLFGRAINKLIERHDSLRTSFAEINAQPMQLVAHRAFLPIHILDLRHADESDRARELRNHVQRESTRQFDLSVAPLLRISVIQLTDQEFRILFVMHHMVFDGGSIAVLYRELAELYTSFLRNIEPALPPLPIQFGDYAVWQRSWMKGDVLERELSYWENALSGVPETIEFASDRARTPVQTFNGGWAHLGLDEKDEADLRAFAAAHNVTLFMLLIAVFGLLIRKYTGEDQFLVGTPFGNRMHTETEGLIGYFSNNLVVRIDCSGSPTFSEYLARVKAASLDAFAHQECPLARVVERFRPNRGLKHNPLFQVMFVLPAPQPFAIDGLKIAPAEVDYVNAPVDLTLTMLHTAKGFGAFVYNADLFDASTAERMVVHFKELLRGSTQNSSLSIAQLQLLGDAERRQIEIDWNDPTCVDRQEVDFLGAFARLVQQTPGSVAVESDDGCLTYAELGRKAEQIAAHLERAGIGPGDVVALLAPRCRYTIAGILGILKAGGVYLPLDPLVPTDRVGYMLSDSGAKHVLAHSIVKNLPTDCRIAQTKLDDEAIYRNDPQGPARQSDPDKRALAYIIYTSGSTGQPKGVMITHEALHNLLDALDGLIGSSDPGVWLAVTNVTFDISVVELIWTVSRGFRVILPADPLRYILDDRSAVAGAGRSLDISLSYFADDDGGEPGSHKYRLLIETAKYADTHGLSAIWLPERHFHSFGGLYPNPSVLGAAIAKLTTRIGIRAGSVVSPLHHPARIAEEWSVVDNLSNGRVALSFASGWHPNDFVLAPDSFRVRKQVMLSDVEVVTKLWRGEELKFTDAVGAEMTIRSRPAPVQRELPIWLTSSGNVETFEAAGRIGANVLTHLLGQSLQDLTRKVAAYREARRTSGHSGRGHVTLMVHTYLASGEGEAERDARESFNSYLRSSMELMLSSQSAGGAATTVVTEDEKKALLSRGQERYTGSSGLFGTIDQVMSMLANIQAAGIDEIGCLIDFGMPFDAVMRSVQQICSVAEKVRRSSRPATITTDPRDITHLQLTPSLARLLLSEPAAFERLSGLRRLLVGGEALPMSIAKSLTALPGIKVFNMYGPTETTVWSAAQEVADPPDHDVFPIGGPLANTRLFITDTDFQLTPVGVPGELCIEGLGLARGYVGKAGLTAAAFVPNPYSRTPGAALYRTGDRARWMPDGRIEFLGRMDHQVKVNGHRVELQEIETVLQTHPDVESAVVMLGRDEIGNDVLNAFVVPRARGSALPLKRLLRCVDELPRDGIPTPTATLPNGLKVFHHNASHLSATYREIFSERCYLQHRIELPDDPLVLDLGANIGLFTLLVLAECDRPRIFAVEPLPPNFALLRSNIAIYDNGSVTAINAAIGEGNDHDDFVFFPNMPGMSSRQGRASEFRSYGRSLLEERLEQGPTDAALVSTEIETFLDKQYAQETFRCPIVTISEIIEAHGIDRIDLLKMDIEGSEYEALRGIRPADWPKIRQIAMEVHSQDLLESIRQLLTSVGFSVHADGLAHFGSVVSGSTPFVAHLYASRKELGLHQDAPASDAAFQDNFGSLRALAERTLPAYMVPTDFTAVASMPLTSSGKIDRRKLASLVATRDSSRSLPAPPPERSPTEKASSEDAEKVVAEVWKQVLKLNFVDPDRNFFDLGGTSLRMVEALALLRLRWPEFSLGLVDLFEFTTVRAIAAMMGATPRRKDAPIDHSSRNARRQGLLDRRTARLESRT
jgi:natural product biosynthesis luciferase-like monooxygenase protein/FkbM family methyltransferase